MTVLMGLRAQLRLARLQLVTDLRTRQGDWPAFVRTVFDAGVDILQVQVGAQDAARHALLEALETARAIAFDHRRLVAVAGDPALAARFGADVLHLGADDGAVAQNRKGLPESSLVGRSVHSGVQLCEALADPGVDYLVVGPVFPGSGQAPDEQLVREAARVALPSDRGARPWFATGGIGAENLQQVLDAGARRIAVGRAVTAASDPGAVVADLSRRLHEVWDADPALQSYRLHGFGNPGVATFRD